MSVLLSAIGAPTRAADAPVVEAVRMTGGPQRWPDPRFIAREALSFIARTGTETLATESVVTDRSGCLVNTAQSGDDPAVWR